MHNFVSRMQVGRPQKVYHFQRCNTKQTEQRFALRTKNDCGANTYATRPEYMIDYVLAFSFIYDYDEQTYATSKRLTHREHSKLNHI